MFNIEGLGNKRAALKPWAAAQWYLNVGSTNSKKVVDIKNKTIFIEEKLASKKNAKSIFSSIAKITSYVVTLGALPSAALFINWIYSSKYKIANFEIKKQDSTRTTPLTLQKTNSLSSKNLNVNETIAKLNNELNQKNQKIADLEKQLNEIVPPLPLRDEVNENLQREMDKKDKLIEGLRQQLLGKTPPLPPRDDEAAPTTPIKPKKPRVILVNTTAGEIPTRKKSAEKPTTNSKTKAGRFPAVPKPKPQPANAGRPLPKPPAPKRFTVNDGSDLSASWIGDFTNSGDLPNIAEVNKQNNAIEDIIKHTNEYGIGELTINLFNKILRSNNNWSDLPAKEKQEIINQTASDENLNLGLKVIIGESIDRNKTDLERYEAIKSDKARNYILKAVDKEKLFSKTKEALTVEAVDAYYSSINQTKEVDQNAQQELNIAIARKRALWESTVFDPSASQTENPQSKGLGDSMFDLPIDYHQ